MPQVVEATYAIGVLKLEQPLPLKDQEQVRVTVESLTADGRSVNSETDDQVVRALFIAESAKLQPGPSLV